LEAQLQNERVKNEQEAEIHAQLEKEMQDRLTQRLAVHLQERAVAMEARIREELEEEYKHMMKQQHLQSKSKSFSASDAKGSHGVDSSSTAFQRELEDQLRKQLQQVKEERERWQAEQEEFQNRVLLSKQQLDKIREGYRTKYDKEKRRANDLDKENKEFQAVIDALHQELNSTKEELDELHMHQSEQKLLLEGMSNHRTNREWEKERKKFLEREKEYQAEVEELQIEVNELQGIDEECQRLEEEKADLVKKCKEIWDEHQSTLQGLYQLILLFSRQQISHHCLILFRLSSQMLNLPPKRAGTVEFRERRLAQKDRIARERCRYHGRIACETIGALQSVGERTIGATPNL
jgi:hypothetical protein